MRQIILGLLVAALTLTGCKKTPAPSQETAGMENMPGMPRVPAAPADTTGVPLNRTEAERLGITFARATERPVRSSVRAVGVLKYAEPNLVYVNARVGGWVEHLYADYVGKRVEQGEPLLALYSPDLVSAQESTCWRGDCRTTPSPRVPGVASPCGIFPPIRSTVWRRVAP